MKRPWYISVFCIAGWLWLFVLFPSVFSPETKKIHLLLPSLYGLIIAFLFIAFVGVWHLKRWGIELFFIFLFLKTYLDNLITHSFSRAETTINLSIGFMLFFIYGLVITFLFYKKMQKGL